MGEVGLLNQLQGTPQSFAMKLYLKEFFPGDSLSIASKFFTIMKIAVNVTKHFLVKPKESLLIKLLHPSRDILTHIHFEHKTKKYALVSLL